MLCEEVRMKKTPVDIRIVVIVFLLCFFTLSAILGRTSPKGEQAADKAQVALQNISPCLEPDWKRTEKLIEGEPEWICADMKTNWTSINLDLLIFNEAGDYVYSDDAPFSSGSIAWTIYPPLPPGKYTARITGFRGPKYADFEFEVVKKGNE